VQHCPFASSGTHARTLARAHSQKKILRLAAVLSATLLPKQQNSNVAERNEVGTRCTAFASWFLRLRVLQVCFFELLSTPLRAVLKEFRLAFQTVAASLLSPPPSTFLLQHKGAAPSAVEIAALCNITAVIPKSCTNCTVGCEVRCEGTQISFCDGANTTITKLFVHHFPLLHADAHWMCFCFAGAWAIIGSQCFLRASVISSC